MIYISTFISGFAQTIEKKLIEDFSDIKIRLLLDGLVVYSTDSPTKIIKKLRYFNNSFILLNQVKAVATDKPDAIVRLLASQTNFEKLLNTLNIPRHQSFRLIVSKENQMIKVNKELVKNIETKIINSTTLQVGPLKADWEFWFLIRAEGYAFFGVRITGLINAGPKEARGELRKELSYLLCFISKPEKTDIFLDPFCGSGQIPLERARGFPYRKIIAGDLDNKVVNLLKSKTINTKDFISIRLDALNLRSIENASIDKIVTDPPWGFYKPDNVANVNFNAMYSKMLVEFKRVLKPGGTIVILTARKELLEREIDNTGLKLLKRYDILVSGKKAGIFVIGLLDMRRMV